MTWIHRSAAAAQRIQNSAEHIEDLISTLLDATRMRLGGTLPVTPGPSDLSEICTQVVEEVKTAYPAHPIELNTSGNLQGVWDHARLDQMLSNLLANAVQHGAEESPVSLSAKDAGDQVLLRVHNQGKAIPPAAQRHIFDPAIQSERSDPEHMGLGLYVVRSVAEAHGGHASVESSEQQGTTFTISLPRTPDKQDPSGSEMRG